MSGRARHSKLPIMHCFLVRHRHEHGGGVASDRHMRVRCATATRSRPAAAATTPPNARYGAASEDDAPGLLPHYVTPRASATGVGEVDIP